MFLQYSKVYHPATFTPSEHYERPSQSVFVCLTMWINSLHLQKKVYFFFPLDSLLALKYSWYEPVRHCSSVALPVLPIFAETTVFIPNATVS